MCVWGSINELLPVYQECTEGKIREEEGDEKHAYVRVLFMQQQPG